MDTRDRVWTSPAMLTARTRGDAGAIVRIVRRAEGLTLAELGAQCGYSASQMSRYERGVQPLTDIALLRRLADALTIPPQVLGLAPAAGDAQVRRHTGNLPTLAGYRSNVGSEPEEKGGDGPVRRRELLAGIAGLAGAASLPPHLAPRLAPHLAKAATTGDPAGQLAVRLEDLLVHDGAGKVGPMPLATLSRSLTAAKADFQHARYASLAIRLPDLIATADATTTDLAGDQQLAAYAILAEAYNVATHVLVKLDVAGLDWISADRAAHAAARSGDVLTRAEATRMLSIVSRRAGHHTTAQRLALDAADQLDIGNAPPAQLSCQGILLANAGYTAARAGDRSRSTELLDHAARIAGRLGGDRNDRWTAFGPTNVTLYRISAAYALGDSGTAIDHAHSILPGMIRLPERQARYWVDVARAYHQWGKPAQCYRALIAAEQAAPQEVRARPAVADLATQLLSAPRHNTMTGLRDFAARVGADL